MNPIKRGSIDADRPDRLDSEVWKRLFISTHFGDSTTELCNAFAEIIKFVYYRKSVISLRTISHMSFDPLEICTEKHKLDPII